MTKTKTIDTLVPDILALFRDGHVTDETLLEEYGKRIAANLSSSLSDGDAHTPRLRLSGIGKPSRRLHYELTNAPYERLQPTTLVKFQYGHMLEEMLLYLAKEAGHDVQYEQREYSFDGITGHIDAIIDGVIVDVKSASPFGFLKFKNGTVREDDPFHYIPQLASYVQADGGGRKGAFLAINKVSGELGLCLFQNEELLEVDIQAHADRQRTVQSNPADLPERCYSDKPEGKSGNMALSTGCSYCKHKFHCWSDANNGEGLRTYLYSNGPKFLTKVVREPKVFQAPAPELYTNPPSTPTEKE